VRWVVVPGTPDPADVTVTVSYDGGEQYANPGQEPAGPAAALAALPAQAPGAGDCSQGWRTEPSADAEVGCEVVYAGTTPYVAGHGWSGTGWAVASIGELRVVTVRDQRGRRYELGDAEGIGTTAQLGTGLAGQVVVAPNQLDGGRLPLQVLVDATAPGSTDAAPMRVSGSIAVAP
jgi:hypothetical protein